MRVNLTINSPTKPIEKNCTPIINNNNPKKNKGFLKGIIHSLYPNFYINYTTNCEEEIQAIKKNL